MKIIDSYRIINIIWAGIIGLVFIYSCLFLPENGNHPIPSFYTDLTGRPSPSIGLSRAFSALVRGQFDLAEQFNPHAKNIFAFFSLQFAYRLVSLGIDKIPFVNKRIWIRVDILLSISLFILAFLPMIHFTFQTLGEVLKRCF